MTDEELEHRLTDVESRSKSNTHRLDDLERLTDAVNGMNTNIKLTIQQLWWAVVAAAIGGYVGRVLSFLPK